MECKICGKEYKLSSHLSQHVSKVHKIEKKQYYDLYLKKDKEDVCEICKKNTPYSGNWQRGYNKYCSKECKSIGVQNEMRSTCLKKYGVKNANQTKKTRYKIAKTCNERYGNSCPMQNKEIQENIRKKNLKNLGVELPFQSKEIQIKSANIREEKYGAAYTLQSKILREKIKNTNIKKYGVDHHSQNDVVFLKQQLSGLKIKKYRNTDLYYQGSFELDFLEKYYDKFEIKRAKSLKYILNENQHVYYPDFYIPKLNLIVEIKNKYLAKRDRIKLEVKKQAVKKLGYNFIMIINKKYEKFETLIS